MHDTTNHESVLFETDLGSVFKSMPLSLGNCVIFIVCQKSSHNGWAEAALLQDQKLHICFNNIINEFVLIILIFATNNKWESDLYAKKKKMS